MAVQKCPQCDYLLQPFDAKCPKCQFDLKSTAPSKAKPAPPAAPQPRQANMATPQTDKPKQANPSQAQSKPSLPASAPQNPPTFGAQPGFMDRIRQRLNPDQFQMCSSCRGKYSVELGICPYCGHTSEHEEHTTPARISLEKERAIIGSVGAALLTMAVVAAFWVFKYQSADLEYRVFGLTDFQLSVETRALDADGKKMRLAGITTYWYKPDHLRVDIESVDDTVHRPLTRIARLGEPEMYTVDTAAGVCFSQSYSPEAMQSPPLRGETASPTATPGEAGVTRPTAWKPSDSKQALFSLLPVYSRPTRPGVRFVQMPVKATPTAPAGPSRTYKLENLGRENIHGFGTIHYRLTTLVSAKGCAGWTDGQEVTEYWIAPNLNGRFFVPDPDQGRSHFSSGNNEGDETMVPTAVPTGTPQAQATPTPVPTATPGPAVSATPLPVPTPYSPPIDIEKLLRPLALTPQSETACTVDNLRSGDDKDFENLFKGLVLKLRKYDGKTLVVEQEVRHFKRLLLADSEFDVSKFALVNSDEFWTKRSAPIAATATPLATATSAPVATPTAAATVQATSPVGENAAPVTTPTRGAEVTRP